MALKGHYEICNECNLQGNQQLIYTYICNVKTSSVSCTYQRRCTDVNHRRKKRSIGKIGAWPQWTTYSKAWWRIEWSRDWQC